MLHQYVQQFLSFCQIACFSEHVKKSRVWAVKQFFHFLVLNQWASKKGHGCQAYTVHYHNELETNSHTA